MSVEYDLAKHHLQALVRETDEAGVPSDVVHRALLNELVASWQKSRAWNDVADELRFTADSLDPETDFEFMRP